MIKQFHTEHCWRKPFLYITEYYLKQSNWFIQYHSRVLYILVAFDKWLKEFFPLWSGNLPFYSKLNLFFAFYDLCHLMVAKSNFNLDLLLKLLSPVAFSDKEVSTTHLGFMSRCTIPSFRSLYNASRDYIRVFTPPASLIPSPKKHSLHVFRSIEVLRIYNELRGLWWVSTLMMVQRIGTAALVGELGHGVVVNDVAQLVGQGLSAVDVLREIDIILVLVYVCLVWEQDAGRKTGPKK